MPEVMVGVFIISLVFLMIVQGFQGLVVGSAKTGNTTRANDRAQAQLGLLKALGHDRLRVTESPQTIPEISPAQYYDPVNPKSSVKR